MTLGTHHELDELGGGRFRHTQHLRPIAYHNGDGVLRRIVNDWVDGDQDSPHVVSDAPMRVRADGVGRRNIYPIPGNDEVYISVGRPWYQPSTWQTAPMNALTRQGNRLQSINTNYNLYLDHAGHFAKLGILLKGGFVPPNSRFAFPVSLVGLTRQGNTILHNGQPVMTLRRPVVYDWQNPDDERDITFNFGSFGSQTGVIFNLPDLTGMGLPLVDPTLTLQPGAADGLDTHTSEGNPTSNFGTNTAMQTNSLAGSRLRFLLKFDLSSLVGATVSSSVLSLWNTTLTANTRVIELYSILAANSGWTEGGATWNYALASSIRWAGDTGADGGADAGCTVAGTDHNGTLLGSFSYVGNDPIGTRYDVTLSASQVQAWVNGANYGMVSHRTSSNTISFATSDNATAANRPQLVTDYTLPAVAGRRLFTPAIPGIFG